MRRGGRAGFTLIELLTVVGIIVILAALTMVAVISAMESGRVANCTSNLSQLHRVILEYTDTYGGYLPAFWHERWVGEVGLVGRRWGNLPDDLYGHSPQYPLESGDRAMPTVWGNFSPSRRYLPGGEDRACIRSGSDVLICKSDTSLMRCDQGCTCSYMGLAKWGWWHRGNEILDATSNYFQYHQLQEVQDPSRSILLCESEPATWQFGNCGCRWHSYRHPRWILNRHYGGGNILHFDGRIRLAKDEQEREIIYWEPDFLTIDPGW